MSEAEIKSRVLKALEKTESRGVYLFVLKPEEYHTANGIIIGNFTEKLNKKGIYVTLNKPYYGISEDFKKRGIDPSGIWFIDGTSKTSEGGKTAAGKGNCTHIRSPESLTELSLAITNASNTGKFHFLFFDSITTLLVYNNVATTEKFMHYIINKLRSLGMGLVLISLNDENSQKLLPVLSQFCDDCVYV